MPKLVPLTAAIAVLWAGDSYLQREVLLALLSEVNARIAAQPENWWLVSDVARAYQRHYNELFHRRAEQHVLMPLGLTYPAFIQNQQRLAPAVAQRLAADLQEFQEHMPSAETLIAGLDPTGAHIYSVFNGAPFCHDASGFAAIGIGAPHADSQFMLARHALNRPLSNTLRLTYFAKKRSEIAPGVGSETDMCLIGPMLGAFKPFSADDISKLEALYQEALKGELELQTKTQQGIDQLTPDLVALPKKQVVATETITFESIATTATAPSPPAGAEAMQ